MVPADGAHAVETKLFKHALDQLDVIYAHKRMASFLSTRAPSGSWERGYYDRGWTNFEMAEGQLIKGDALDRYWAVHR